MVPHRLLSHLEMTVSTSQPIYKLPKCKYVQVQGLCTSEIRIFCSQVNKHSTQQTTGLHEEMSGVLLHWQILRHLDDTNTGTKYIVNHRLMNKLSSLILLLAKLKGVHLWQTISQLCELTWGFTLEMERKFAAPMILQMIAANISESDHPFPWIFQENINR